MGYDVARDSLFAWEQRQFGRLTCVYTGFSIVLTPGADPSTDAFNQGINTEHTWPQSRGASTEPSRSDMHHLYPVRDNVNSVRNNHPYGEIPDAETDGWYRLATSQSTIPTAFLDEWSEKDNQHPSPLFTGRFEPREDHEGNAARAVFYYRAVYPDRVAAAGADEFFEVQRPDLLRWARLDPVDVAEMARGEWIAGKQGGRRNPFLLDSTLARRAFGSRIDAGGGPPPAYSSVVWLNEIHYENVGPDAGEFVEVAVPLGIDPATVMLTLYNGNGGAPYGTVTPVSAFTPGQVQGDIQLYTLSFPTNGLQNGSPDGLALSIDGEVVQFLSYEGVFEASGGIAEGMTSVDIGVQQTDQTPLAHSLQLRGAGSAYGDFTWAAPSPSSPGLVNAFQTFEIIVSAPAPPQEAGLALSLAGPNPFRSATTVRLTLPAAVTDARVELFDTVGRRVGVLHHGPLAAGERLLVVEAEALPPSVYVVRALVGGDALTLRLVVVN